MALTDESGFGVTMPVAPAAYGYGMPYSNGGGLFGNGGDSWLGILFLIALCNGGFGFGGFGGGWGAMGMMNGMYGMGIDYLYPFQARRLRPLRLEMNCVSYTLDFPFHP